MTAHEIHALSGAYAVDALDDLERARFEAHLAVCAECRAEVASLTDTTFLLAGLSEVAPPAAVRAAVLDGIKKVRPLPPVVARIEARRPRRWTTLVAAAAVLGTVGTGTYVVTHDQQSHSVPPSAINPVDRVLRAADVQRVTEQLPGGASATVSWSPSEHRAVLITRSMAAAPAGHVYELWFQKGGTMVAAGTLGRSADQTYVMQGDPVGATAVGMTVEPAGGSTKPTTTPVALLSLEST